MLTDCFPALPIASEDPIRGLANHSVKDDPAETGTIQYTVKICDIFRTPPQEVQRNLKEDVESKEKVSLLLTELEVRVISCVDAQELSRTTGEALQVLHLDTVVSEIQLSGRPLLVFTEEEQTVREAYRLLHSLFASCKPVPKPRKKGPVPSGQQSSLMKALKRGIETGNRVLTLVHNTDTKTFPEDQQESVIIKDSGSSDSDGSLSFQSHRKPSRDIQLITYKRLEGLEETIRELEKTLKEISELPTAEQLYTDAADKDTPVQMSGGLTLENKKPPVPPKPSSLIPASIQVHSLRLLCRTCSNAACCFLSSLLSE